MPACGGVHLITLSRTAGNKPENNRKKGLTTDGHIGQVSRPWLRSGGFQVGVVYGTLSSRIDDASHIYAVVTSRPVRWLTRSDL